MLYHLARRIVAYELAVVLVLTPLLLFPEPTGGLALLGVPLLWLVRWYVYGQIVPRTPLDWPLLLMLTMVFVSMLITFDPALSGPKVAGVVLGVAWYYALVAKMRSSRELWWGLAFLVMLAGSVATLGLLGTTWFSKLPILAALAARLPQLEVLTALPGSPPEGFSPNQVAGALIWALPLLLVLVWGPVARLAPFRALLWRRCSLVAAAAALLLIALTLLLTQSRGGYVGLLAGLGAMTFWLAPGQWRRWLAVSLAGLAGVAILLRHSLIELAFANEALERTPGNTTESLQFRLDLWPQALEAIRDFPLTGIGIGTFRRLAPDWYYTPAVLEVGDIGHAHNLLINVALDIGLPGMLAFCALWVIAAGMCVRVGLHAAGSDWRLVGLGLFGGMTAHFVWGIFDANALGSKPGLLFWIWLGLVVSLYTWSLSPTSLEPGATTRTVRT